MAGPSLMWVPDILGTPFEQLTLPLGVDGEQGPLVATLVRSIPSPFLTPFAPLRDVDVLDVHGWSDPSGDRVRCSRRMGSRGCRPG